MGLCSVRQTVCPVDDYVEPVLLEQTCETGQNRSDMYDGTVT